MIKCTKCLEIKSENNFVNDKSKKNNKKSHCKSCVNLYFRQRYEKDPEGQRNKSREYRKKLRTEFPEKLKESQRKSALKKHYNLTLEEYNLKLQEQNGVCEICKTPPNKKQLAVDHCHKTGKIRKLLCANCNTALGLLYDDVNIITSLRNYIIKHQEELGE